MSLPTRARMRAFRRRVLRFYAHHGRDLPFRRTTDSYRIAVAEIMLQQTQVDRVIPKWQAWIRRWPNWSALARAPWPALLNAWSGLGYNRRCYYLAQCARRVVAEHHGTLPTDPAALRKLPGIGPYTANAVLIFAHNAPLTTIDTNIRRVLHREFQLPLTTSKAELERLARALLPRGRSRDWHNALMDYAALKLPRRALGEPRPPRQSRFEGSRRQLRGLILRELAHAESITRAYLIRKSGRPDAEIDRAINSLLREGVVIRQGKRITLPREVAMPGC